MTSVPDWIGMEDGISRLFPFGGVSPDRPLLLSALGSYAARVVREARRQGAMAPTPSECARALEWLRFPVFVCGHHRTGTTLMQDLLDGHPDLRVLPNEATYLTSFAYAAQMTVSREATDRFAADWICRFADPNFEPHFLLGRSGSERNPSVLFARRLFGWQEALSAAWPLREPFALLLSLVAAFGDVVSPQHVPRLWVEKTPLNERKARRLAEAFPEARFIHLVREPAATLASVIEAYRSTQPTANNTFRHARAIGRSLDLATRNHRRFASRYLIVRYEALSGNPKLEMERVREFLAIAVSPSLSTPSVLGRPVRSNSSFQPGDAGVVVPPRATPSLPGDAPSLVRAMTASPARDLGYDVKPLSFLPRAAVLLRELPRYALGRILKRS